MVSFQSTELKTSYVTDVNIDTIFLLGNLWVMLNPDFPTFEMLEILTTLGLLEGKEVRSLTKCARYFGHRLDFRVQRTCQLVRIN